MAETRKPTKEVPKTQNRNAQKQEKPQSWTVLRSLFSCKHLHAQIQQQKQEATQQKQEKPIEESSSNKVKCKKMKCSGSLCSNTKVMHRPERSPSPEDHCKKRTNSHESSSRSMKAPLSEASGGDLVSALDSSLPLSSSSNSVSTAGSFRGIPFRRFSGCYECKMVVDPVLGMARDPSLRATICSCPVCGEIFVKAESLELHQAVKHAVSELGPEDTSKNIVEIIFQSSWLRKQSPVCKIDRILKVNNTQKTIAKFEEYRDSIKAKAAKLPKKQPRCAADGNELLRFHCTTVACSLGLNGSNNLCNSIPICNICGIIKNGLRVPSTAGKGILTTATSGKAHDSMALAEGEQKRAMLVCRVIAGRVRKSSEGSVEEYDSVARAAGAYYNLDELYVFNPSAVLPCFIVIYGGF